ncbi:MAG: glutathione S-transferase [Sandaracinaceae bacterium]
MKLFYSTTSPYSRKVRVQALECGLLDRIEPIDIAAPGAGVSLSPVSPRPDVSAANPLGKIPTLVLDDGTALFDSRVIAEYLDSLHDGPPLLPPAGPERFHVLRQVALGDGICDAAVLSRYETFLRPEALRWDAWTEGQQLKIQRALALLESEVGGLPSEATLGTIALGVALGYLDLRLGEGFWRTRHPACADWYERFKTRPAMLDTQP